MALQLNWVGEEAYSRVALTRMRCYAPAVGKLDRFELGMTVDGRQKPGDFLLATRDGVDVGTATALSLQMWIRGARVPCQGVAYVGTIKTHRRGGSDAERGVASQIMTATLALARERGEVVSALMPFRASFYEHFGYGNAELRVEWNVPLAILPRGDFAGYRFAEAADEPALVALRAREAGSGQCDVETDAAAMNHWSRQWPDGMLFVDQPTSGGPIEGYAFVIEERGPVAATAIVEDWSAADPAAFLRLLHFLGSLKDQYSVARITLPRDLPLNRLLRETQIPHRQVDHPVSTSRPYTRMQIRVLDHKRLLEAMTLLSVATGKVNVAIKETEGTITRFGIDLQGGKCRVASSTGSNEVEMTDVLWASIVSGDLPATTAHAMGLIRSPSREAVALLDAFAAGPAPFCQEYF